MITTAEDSTNGERKAAAKRGLRPLIPGASLGLLLIHFSEPDHGSAGSLAPLTAKGGLSLRRSRLFTGIVIVVVQPIVVHAAMGAKAVLGFVWIPVIRLPGIGSDNAPARPARAVRIVAPGGLDIARLEVRLGVGPFL